ncbi:guanine nucleotide-binding protein subunit gamma-1-like [Diprion similis]|uniref:guanine nucleotide-binding protein subunit gamma-1-like n=1 Tax=Diprion similis TaxID=362088 RepID=UPI001EF8F339|nr:guanine nucleotide-binding protein subunit gamma-1-like [Diprion similis]
MMTRKEKTNKRRMRRRRNKVIARMNYRYFQLQINWQLRREAAVNRMPLSETVEDIINYIKEHEQTDCLVVGFASVELNPFHTEIPCISPVPVD